jgi:DNA-directed RNA polymerase subunit beta'
MKTDVFYNKTINKKELKSIIQSTFQSYGIVTTTQLTEGLKKSGFSFATQAGISISIEDLKVPPTKDILFSKNNTDIKLAYYYEKRGNTNEVERFQKVIDTWHTTSEILKNQLVDYFKTVDPLNPVYMMAFSGARGNLSQVRQLVGMRGLMADPNGQIIDLPIKTNFREGLSITDYVISSYGARKGIVDTALRTADSGYLTRRLVDVAQHIIIRELDCQTKSGVRLFYDPKHSKIEQYIGRVISSPVYDATAKKILLQKNIVLTTENLSLITSPTNLILRSPLICESSRSICQKCYGWNLSQGQLVELADAVGIIAAQSIGEPGTQLTMRTFHTGGVFTGESNNQIRSLCDGEVLFSSNLKTVISRTLHGEIILKAINISELFILNREQKTLKRCFLTPEMLIFVANKRFIKSGDLIAESPLLNQRTTTKIKNIFSETSGEIQFQNIPSNQHNKISHDGLIWVASGKIYDILPNMLVKQSGDNVLKSGAIAQTKIISRISGIVKVTKSNTHLSNSIVNCTLLASTKSFYQTKKQELFLVSKKNESYFISKSMFEKNVIQMSFASRVTKKYELPPAHIFYYSKTELLENNKIKGMCICLLKQINNIYKSSKSPNLIQTHNIENTIENQSLDNKILYSGEYINSTIEINILSYCQIVSINKDNILLKISPLKQWVVPKPEKINNQTFSLKHFSNSQLRKIVYLLATNNTEVENGQNLIKTDLKFEKTEDNYNNSPKFKLIPSIKSNSKQVALFQIFKFPTNLVNIDKKQIKITYLNKPNHYIQAYSIIATINCFSNQKQLIQNLKNLKEKPNRFLISTKENYKFYSRNPSFKIKDSKFVVLGDKIDKYQVTQYSGYLLNKKNKSELQIRISSPFFVSNGTRIFIKHGSLIQENESLFQFLYTRVISSDIVTGLPRIEQLLESRVAKNSSQLIERPGVIKKKSKYTVTVIEKCEVRDYEVDDTLTNLLNKGTLVEVGQPLDLRLIDPHQVLNLYFKYYCSLYTFENAAKRSILNIQILLVNLIQGVYKSQGIYISNKHVEVIVRQITSKVKISELKTETTFEIGEFLEFEQAKYINMALKFTKKPLMEYQPVLLGITKVSLMTESFISSASFQETTRVLTKAAIEGKVEWLRGLKENVILGRLVPAGTGFKAFNSVSLLNIRVN